MYIPTQEERYAKKGVVSLILCVVVPSCLYVSLLSKQLMMVRGHEWEAVMKLFLAFTYPLAYADLILNGDVEAYLNAVTEYKPYEN